MATSTKFSITVTVGSANKEITLYASDFASIATNGFHFALPANSTTAIGSLSEFIAWINGRLADLGIATNAALPTAAPTGWPTPLKDALNGALTAQVTVNRFSVDVTPKTGGGFNDAEYSLDVTAKTAAPVVFIPNVFSVVGAGIELKKTNT